MAASLFVANISPDIALTLRRLNMFPTHPDEAGWLAGRGLLLTLRCRVHWMLVVHRCRCSCGAKHSRISKLSGHNDNIFFVTSSQWTCSLFNVKWQMR